MLNYPYEVLFSDDVKRIRWQDERANTKYIHPYFSTTIAQQRGKYSYGYQFNAQRMKKQIIMLPSLSNSTLNFAIWSTPRWSMIFLRYI